MGGRVLDRRAWYVAQVKPHAEVRAAAVLAQRGLEAFLPLLRRRGRHAGLLGEPLFRGYLFARLDVAGEEVLVARSAPGVLYLLGERSAPLAVPDGLVAAIRARMVAENQARGAAGYREGEPVRLLAGPFRDLEAVFDRRLNAAGRARVFVELLGRLVPVETDLALLRPR